MSAFRAAIRFTAPNTLIDPEVDLPRREATRTPLETHSDNGVRFEFRGGRPYDCCELACNDRYVLFGKLFVQNMRHLLSLAGSEVGDRPIDTLLAVLTEHGLTRIRAVLGNFALVCFDRQTRSIVLLRDAFGVEPLYYRISGEEVLVASEASALGATSEWDKDFIGDYLVVGWSQNGRTIYRGVRAALPGALTYITRQEVVEHRYWDAFEFSPDHSLTFEAATDECRRLLLDAVKVNLTGADDTWAALSGGIDSSTIVSVAQHLTAAGEVRSGLAGTLTYWDNVGNEDERDFAKAVVEMYGVRNCTIKSGWPLQGFDGNDIEASDLPTNSFLGYTTHRAVISAATSRGGCVYLNGLGPDHILGSQSSYLADLIAAGKIGLASREALQWAATKQQSYWRFMAKHGIDPLLPRALRIKRALRRAPIAPWMRADYLSNFNLCNKLPAITIFDAPWGRKNAAALASQLQGLAATINPKPYERDIVERFPYLYRPFVEFVLRCPPMFRVAPGQYKRILRAAVQGILPEAIRQRRGKASGGARAAWALRHEGELVASLSSNMIVADLGIVEPRVVNQQLALIQQQRSSKSTVAILRLLSLESWLRLRSGRPLLCDQ